MGELTAARFDRELMLRDGTRVRMRPIRPDDEPRLVALYDHLGRDTRYQRFFSVMRRLPPDWAHFLANVDYARRFALVAEAPGDADTLIAVARYEPAGEPDTVEVAFVVQDAWQERGLGTLLFRDLLAAAEGNGIRRFRAWVLADNRRMLDLISRLGEVQQRAFEQGVVELTFVARPLRSSPSRETSA
ncbi:MAG TPA: GNAT family N-acetyltransferase [Methylomirabilota bacterium]|jgi:RimJ/RimL family protein N-acetyltransferase